MRVSVLLSALLLLFTIGLTVSSRNVPATSFFALPGKEAKSGNLIKQEQLLGEKIFFDSNLSNPAGLSCASCHSPQKGFADPLNRFVSAGAVKGLSGNRNAASVAYAAFTPPFHFDSTENHYAGGFFWDGRANSLTAQATVPLFSHLEMNADKNRLAAYLQQSSYRQLFEQVYGEQALDDPETAVTSLAKAIAAFEHTSQVSPFSSKYDLYLKGKTQLNDQELRGLQLFNDPKKGNCAACHSSEPDPETGLVLFTDFTYDNIGLPANPEIKKEQKGNYIPDLGLGAVVRKPEENGKFKVPTLRNVALTAPYFHNGVIASLEETVRFYNERDTGRFGKPEVPENMNNEELGNLKLTEQEIRDITAFMRTLTDGYRPG
ncbi:cytochrome-c peroxidase [Adhaeribacter soli]|uniref:C-type cytochrome n=1 Tax=Adhaeribacter soli TaxID=2607655 RepID=A0A5N1IUG1_9BACT|nr:cytochrome c peroxidase [Adhaeribacter soli]KAA9333694.1 c-type cytochrome [Adhaeribacter soli]